MSYPPSFPSLTTERLTLRQLRFDDTNAIFRLRSSKEINKLISRETPKTLNDAKAFIQVCHQEFEKEHRIFWAMQLENPKQLIGTIVFHKIDLENKYAEVGSELNPDFQGNRFMSEAMKTVIEFGKTILKLKTIEAFTHQNNSASIALLEKHQFGLQPERREKGFENNRIFRLEISQQ